MDDIHITPRPNGMTKSHHVASVLRDAIRAGTLPAGSKVPTAASLSEQLGYDYVTVLRGYGLLRQEGILSVEQGRGTFVRVHRLLRHPLLEYERIGSSAAAAEPIGLFERGTGVEESAVRVDIEYSQVPAPEGLAEDIEPGTPMLDRRYLWFVDGKTHQDTHSYLPYALVEGTPLEKKDQEQPGRGTLTQLRDVGVHVDRTLTEISARAPSPEEAALLHIDPTTPILVSRRQNFAQGQTVSVADSITPSDRIMFTMETSVDENGEMRLP